MTTNFTVNGRAASTDAPSSTPLLWVIREGLKLTGTKFGLDGWRQCQPGDKLPFSAVFGDTVLGTPILGTH